MPHDFEGSRRLQTPPPRSQSLRVAEGPSEGTARTSRHRSLHRSRTRAGSSKHRYRSRSPLCIRSSTRERDRLREHDRGLNRERERLRGLQEEVRRERNRLRSAERNERKRMHCRSTSRRASQHRDRSNSNCEEKQRRPVEPSDVERRHKHPRSESPYFTAKDIVTMISALKDTKPQPSTTGAPIYTNVNHKNILPDFDPSSKNQRVDIWIKKVNECATVYSWDDKTTIHFAMQKLQGLAKVWYESLNSILFTWLEWQEKLLSAFPYEQNYGQSLEEMLKRRSRYNEPLEVYYYDKLALLNQCDIDGKRAADCIIHGLSDKTLKSSALALRCSHPDQLLQFLVSNKETPLSLDRSNFKSRPGINTSNNNATVNKSTRIGKPQGDNVLCFNCKEIGHPFLRCTKPLIRCTHCHRVGHKTENCRTRVDSQSQSNKDSVAKNTMCISNSRPNSKFFKEVQVNDATMNAFVDFGSEVSLLTKSIMSSLGLVCDNVPSMLKGFGNDAVATVGQTTVKLTVDGVSATVSCQVVEDTYLDVPLLIGQSFTEQAHVVVYKNADKLQFFNIDTELPFSHLDLHDDRLVIVQTIEFIHLYGPASIRAAVEPQQDGNILLDSKIIGKPPQQSTICGGIYPVKNGVVNICVFPLVNSCVIPAEAVISRATRVQMVNCIVSQQATTIHSEFDEEQVKIDESIGEADKRRLLKLLRKYNHCFASTLKELGCTDVAEMTIEVNSNRPIVYRPYRLAHKEREQVREMVDELLDAGIIQESVSEYASPIILVRKKDGKLRLCIDFRMLNSVTVKERYPMPNIEDEIARLSGQAYFITLDLASGYYQVPISEQSRPLTSFVTPDGQYEFNRMPFGLANAPAVFQRMMNRVLSSSRFSEATAYIDDVLIYGRSIEECLSRLEHVLELLEKANLTLNLSKCEFLRDKIDYLGYEISAAGVRPGTKKIQCVLDFPRPTNHHSVRQFLGLIGYFRKFIKNFAVIAHPLNNLLKKDVAWTWVEDQEKAFTVLKNKLVDRPILAIYDPTAETELHTDASKVGVGGILLQRQQKDEPFRAVAFYSRQTSPEEKNFHSYELETLAVICSLKKFRVYLLGQSFKVVTDCSALRSTFSKRDLIPRIARWWLLMQEFHCTVEYRAGVKMSHVDALSRNPVADEDVTTTDQYPSVMSITSEDWLQTLQLGDSELRRIRDILTSNMDADGLQYLKNNFIIKDDKLYRCLDGDQTNIRWVVPKGARWQLCRLNHDDIGHFGIEKTMERMKKSYWFPKMSRFIKKYVSACIECAYAKKSSVSKEGQLHVIEKVEVPFHTLHIDHLGPFVKSKKGNTHLLVAVDGFTKFVFIKPVRNTKSENTIRALQDIFCIFRNPDRIISDRGTSFTSHAFKRFCFDKGIKHVLNAVASPRSNGQVERYNRTILSSLTAQNLNCHEKCWDEAVGKVQWGLNNTCQKTTGRTPAEVMFGSCMNAEINPILNEIRQETRENSDLTTIREAVKDKINAEQKKQKENYDKNRRPARMYSEGELVKITKISFNNDGKSKKLLPSYIGPYKVIEVLDNDRYRVASVPGLTGAKNKRITTIAADRMLPWIHVAALEIHQSDDDDGSNSD